MKTISWLSHLTAPGGDPVYMAFATKRKTIHLYGQKSSLPTVSLAGGSVCGPFPSTGKILALLLSNTLSMSSKKRPFLIMFPSGAVTQMKSRGRSLWLPKWPRYVSCLSPTQVPWPWKVWLAVNVDMNFGNPIDISDIKKMNDEGIEMVADRIQAEFQRLDEETKQWHNDKTKPTLVVCPHPCPYPYGACWYPNDYLYLHRKFIWNPDKKRVSWLKIQLSLGFTKGYFLFDSPFLGQPVGEARNRSATCSWCP